MANNPDGAETFHEVPASKYYYLGDVIGAVPKAFFKYWSGFLISFTAIATFLACETTVWQQLLGYIFVKQALYSWPLTLIIGTATWLLIRRRQKRLAREKANALHRRRFEEATIKNAGGGKRR